MPLCRRENCTLWIQTLRAFITNIEIFLVNPLKGSNQNMWHVWICLSILRHEIVEGIVLHRQRVPLHHCTMASRHGTKKQLKRQVTYEDNTETLWPISKTKELMHLQAMLHTIFIHLYTPSYRFIHLHIISIHLHTWYIFAYFHFLPLHSTDAHHVWERIWEPSLFTSFTFPKCILYRMLDIFRQGNFIARKTQKSSDGTDAAAKWQKKLPPSPAILTHMFSHCKISAHLTTIQLILTAWQRWSFFFLHFTFLMILQIAFSLCFFDWYSSIFCFTVCLHVCIFAFILHSLCSFAFSFTKNVHCVHSFFAFSFVFMY